MLRNHEHVRPAHLRLNITDEQGVTRLKRAEHSLRRQDQNIKITRKHLQDGPLARVLLRALHRRLHPATHPHSQRKDLPLHQTVSHAHPPAFGGTQNVIRQLHSSQGTNPHQLPLEL